MEVYVGASELLFDLYFVAYLVQTRQTPGRAGPGWARWSWDWGMEATGQKLLFLQCQCMPAARLPGQVQQPVRHPQESPGAGEEDPQWC